MFGLGTSARVRHCGLTDGRAHHGPRRGEATASSSGSWCDVHVHVESPDRRYIVKEKTSAPLKTQVTVTAGGGATAHSNANEDLDAIIGNMVCISDRSPFHLLKRHPIVSRTLRRKQMSQWPSANSVVARLARKRGSLQPLGRSTTLLTFTAMAARHR